MNRLLDLVKCAISGFVSGFIVMVLWLEGSPVVAKLFDTGKQDVVHWLLIGGYIIVFPILFKLFNKLLGVGRR
ncbi:hypothetical protein [Microbulbifer aestuariivivens]|uniref:hypothetical protein n=1 Tax=Microbulbifer aestuariivivens TaxID=1908308 RepID=UPI0031EE2E7E